MATKETQICNGCEKELPLKKFQPLASGRGYYKNCMTCKPPASQQAAFENEETVSDKSIQEKKPKSVITKEIQKPKAKLALGPEALLANFDIAYTNLRGAHVEQDPVKIGTAFSEFMNVHTKLQMLIQ